MELQNNFLIIFLSIEEFWFGLLKPLHHHVFAVFMMCAAGLFDFLQFVSLLCACLSVSVTMFLSCLLSVPRV